MITKTEAIRRVLERAKIPISLMDAQALLRLEYGVICTDSSIGRRFREFGADCLRGRDGVYRYSARHEGQAETFKEST